MPCQMLKFFTARAQPVKQTDGIPGKDGITGIVSPDACPTANHQAHTPQNKRQLMPRKTTIDACIVCGWPVALHFVDGRAIGCDEVQIQITGILPAYPRGWDGCTQ